MEPATRPRSAIYRILRNVHFSGMRPFISANLAISADGKISDSAGRPSGWTSARDHERFRELRSGADALLVGRGTWDTDRMKMVTPTHPLRCVVSRSGGFDVSHPMFSTPGGPIHLLVTGNPNADVLPGATLHHQSLPEFLETLSREHGVSRIHCEGGGELVRALVELGSLDELHLTWAGHTLFGGLASPTLTGHPGSFLPDSTTWDLTSFEPADDECFLTYRRKGPPDSGPRR